MLIKLLKSKIAISQYLIILVNIVLLFFPNHIFAVDTNTNEKTLTVKFDKDFEKSNIFKDEIKILNRRIEVLEQEIDDIKKEYAIPQEKIIEKKEIKNKNPVEENIFELTDKEQSAAIINVNIEEITKENKSLYELAFKAFKEKKYTESTKKFGDFIKKNTNSPLGSNAYYWYAESYFKQNDYNNAAINYLKGYKLYPKGQKSADSLLKLAYSLEKLGKKKEARQVLIKLKEEFPKRTSSQIKATQDALNRIDK